MLMNAPDRARRLYPGRFFARLSCVRAIRAGRPPTRQRICRPGLQCSGFQTGLRMYAAWNDVGVAAELADVFVAFYWSTAA